MSVMVMIFARMKAMMVAASMVYAGALFTVAIGRVWILEVVACTRDHHFFPIW
jgi:hypothetical protein